VSASLANASMIGLAFCASTLALITRPGEVNTGSREEKRVKIKS